MENLFFITFLLSFVLLVIGLIKPKRVIWWGKRNRKQVLVYYCGLMFLSLLFVGMLTEPVEDRYASPEGKEIADQSVAESSGESDEKEEVSNNPEESVDQEDSNDADESVEKQPTEQQDEKVAEQSTNVEESESEEKQDPAEMDSTENATNQSETNEQKLSRKQALTITKNHFPDATITSEEDGDIEVQNEIYYSMNGVTGTSPAFLLYINKNNGKLYHYSSLDEKISMLEPENQPGYMDKKVEQANENGEILIDTTTMFYDSFDGSITVKGETSLADGINVKVTATNIANDTYQFGPVKATVTNGSFYASLGLGSYVLNGPYEIDIDISSVDNQVLIEKYGKYKEFNKNYQLTGATVEKDGWFGGDYIIKNSYQLEIDQGWTEVAIKEDQNLMKMQAALAMDFEQLAKSPNRYKGEYVTFSGEITNIDEGDSESYMVIAVTKDQWGSYNYHDTIVVDYKGYTDYYQGDIVSVYGEVKGEQEMSNSIGAIYMDPLIQLDIIQ